ncbi:hypothetical protein ACFQX8_00260 [Klenkia terrae]|uniref:hypothetical protein n=1 Tax=Klenkia terrae TaxID=1052259 RepID=UPI00361C2617
MPTCTRTTAAPSSSVRIRVSRTVAATRSASTDSRCCCTGPVAAASLTVRTASRAEASDRPKAARRSPASRPARPAAGAPRNATSTAPTITPPVTAPASGCPVTAMVSPVTAAPMPTSIQRSAQFISRSESSARAVTSPAGVRASRYCSVCPRSTASRSRSVTDVHQIGYSQNAHATNSDDPSSDRASSTETPVGSSPRCRPATRSPHSAPVNTP